MSRPRLLGSGSNPPRLTGPSSIQLQPYGPSRASRMVGILFFMAVGIGALWVGFSVLTGRIEPADPVRLATTPPALPSGYPTLPAPTPWTTPLVDDYVLSQDDRLSLEATRAAVQADLDRIGGEIAQADESRKLALLRRQQELELEREAIGNRLLAIQTEAEAARVTQEAERANVFLQLDARQTAVWTDAQAIVAAGNARATVRAQEIQADKDKADADLAASQANVYRLAVWIAGTLFVLVMLILSGIAFVFGWPHLVRATMEAQTRLQLLRERATAATQQTTTEGDSLLQEWDEAARRGASDPPPADGFGPPPNYPPVRNGDGRGPARNYGNGSGNSQEPFLEPPRTVLPTSREPQQNRSENHPEPPQNRSQNQSEPFLNRPEPPQNRSQNQPEPFLEPQEPTVKLDPTRPPTAEEQAVIVRWYHQLGGSASATCRALYGHKNAATWKYVGEAIRASEESAAVGE